MNYIRFFISSTFTDMSRERDILNRVLTDLRSEFICKDWMIEWVDLRWGISQEASLDNRTMRICIEELNRCRELSPRPNFIILAGERYGWVPLPEVIPFSDVDLDVLNQLDESDISLFRDWYLLDRNALPCGEFILKPRRNEFVNNDIYESLVVTGLRSILSMVCKGVTADRLRLSATAQEIYCGLDGLTASDTFVYRRHLANIPQEFHPLFKDDDKEEIEKIKDLYAYIDALSEKDNNMHVYGEYKDYIDGRYDQEIETGMRSNLYDIISKVIAERQASMSKSENAFHLTLASEWNKNLVGRKDTLRDLLEYISSDDRHPLLISAPSGIGKSSLMAILVSYLCDHTDYKIVARFCGETRQSSEVWTLLDGIFNDIFVYTDKPHRGPIKLRRNINQVSAWWGPKDIFTLKCNRKVVVVIDSINCVDDSQAEFFFSLKWLDVILSENIKVIVTSTPEVVTESSYDHIRCIPLYGLGSESIELINSILARKHRTLSNDQYEQVRNAIAASDKSGIYLNLLANYLIDLPSWLKLTKIPHTVDSLLDLILNKLRYPENHGQRLVNLSLRLLAASSMGLSDEEIFDLLASDDHLADEVKSNAMHSLSSDSPVVPRIFWIRLQSDLHGLIKKRQTPVGFQTVLAHNVIRDYVYRRIMPDNITRYQAYEAIYGYLSSYISNDIPHAVHECALLAYNMVLYGEAIDKASHGGFRDKLDYSKNVLKNLLVNPDYIINKAIRFRSDLLKEYSEYGSVFKDPSFMERLTRIGNDIVSLPEDGDNEAMRSFIFNLPDNSELRKSMSFLPSDRILLDIWKNHRIDHSIVHAVYDVGYSPNISIDGNKIASLSDNGHSLKIIDYAVSECQNISIPLGIKGTKLISDDMLKVHVVTAQDRILLIESDTRNILRWNVTNATGFISSDGRFVTICYDRICLQYDRLNGVQDYFEWEYRSIFPASSGRYVWFIDSDNSLIRWDFVTKETIGFKKAEEILFATDNAGIVKNSSEIDIFSHYVLEGRHKFKSWTLPYYFVDKDQIWSDVSSDSIYLSIGKALQEITIKQDGISVLTHGTQPDVVAVKGEYALRNSPLSLVQWRPMICNPNINMAFNKGIGSFSASEDGSIALMSLGVNFIQESYDFVIILDEEGWNKIHLPFVNKEFVIITSVAVSPDGKYIGACSNLGEIILVRRSDMSLIDSFFKSDSGCLGISFSADSKKLLAVADDFIATPRPVIHIGDTEIGKIYSVPGQLDWKDPELDYLMPWPQGESKFLQGDRYVRLGNFDIWDLKNKRMVLPPNTEIPFHDTKLPESKHNSIGHGPRECIFQHPQSGLLMCSSKGIQTEVDLTDGSIRQYENDKDLIGISVDGNFMFYLDSQSNLWVYCRAFSQMIAHEIVAVYPSVFSPMEIFAYTSNGYVCLMNIHGEEQARAYVPDLWHAIPTMKGLAVATPRGPLLLTSTNQLKI